MLFLLFCTSIIGENGFCESKAKTSPDVKLRLAENETDPEKALQKFRMIIEKNPGFRNNDRAALGMCRIFHLQSRWNDLEKCSRAGISAYKKNPSADEFRYFLALALAQLGRYDEARKECLALCESNHGYEMLSKTLLLLSHINKKITGYSDEYIETLKDVTLGLYDSEMIQTSIFLLGDFFENKKDYDRAYSAYTDVVKYFPDSPEAALSLARISLIKEHNPVRKKYFSDSAMLAKAEKIDITPEINGENPEKTQNFFSVSIGSFGTINETNEIKKILADFGTVKAVKLRTGYSLLVGMNASSDEAMKTKIRLAEEQGINGKIVKISTVSGKKYIYGE